MNLDMRTVVFLSIIIYLVCTLFTVQLWRQNRHRFAGLIYWVFTFIMQTAALVLIILRDTIPDFFSIVLANTLIIAGIIAGYIGLERFVNKKGPQIHNYLMLICFTGVHIYFTYAHPALAVRNLNVSLGLLFISLQCCWLLFHRVGPDLRPLTFSVGMVFGGYCVVSILRIIGFFAGVYTEGDYFHSGTFHTVVLVLFQVLIVLLTYGLVMMVNKRLLMEIGSQEEKFAKAFHSAPFPIMLTRLSDGVVLDANESFFALSGYSSVELMGHKTTDFNIWEREEDRAAVIDALSKDGKVHGMELHFRKKNGESITGFFSGEVILINGEKSTLSSFINITELKLAEDRLRESEVRFRDLFNAIGDGVFIADREGRFVEVNPAACDQVGYSRDELIGTKVADISTLSEIDLKQLVRELNESRTIRYETVHRHKDGRLLAVDLTLTILEQRGSIMIMGIARDITKRKEAEEALSQSEEKYRTILESMEEGYYEVDIKGTFIFCNNAMAIILGYSRDELMGMNNRDYMRPETAKQIYSLFNEVYKTGNPGIVIDHEVIRKDGSVKTLQLSVSLLRNSIGEPIGFRGITRDVSELKIAEKALRESEEKYRSILETMEEGLLENDLKGNYTFVNDAACRLNGYSRDELIGMNYRKLFSPKTVRQVREVFKKIYETGKPEFLIDYEVICKDGSIRIHESNTALLRDRSGQPIGFRNLVRDVTDYKNVVYDLRQSEEKYRNILETMEEGLVESDLGGHIIYVNNAACKLFGYNRDELIGMSYKKRHSPETSLRLYEVFHRIYETGEPELLLDYEVIRKDGSVRIFQSNVALMRDASGQPVGFRDLVRDVTEIKKAEEEKAKIEKQLSHAQKMESVGSLAGGVAHDFNNMLTVILGYTELIKSRLPRDDSLFNDILEIEKAADRSKKLTRQLLAYSRKEIIAPKQINLNVLIVGIEKTLSSLIGEDIDLRFFPNKDIWNVKFDPSQMEMILINLAANARDAMPSGGKLTIETNNIQLNEEYCRVHVGFSPGDYVLLEVSDDGIGMNKETMEHVYEPFFTTKETGKGTGLGLATVYGIVTQNGGIINVYSEPGKGTSFKIYIPKSLEEGGVKKEVEEDLITSGTGTVMLVEDDDMVRKITTEMLEKIGYTTLSVATPMEALSIFKNDDKHIDLVITDVVMPQMSGRELSEKIKALRPGLKVLFSSGYSTNVIAHQGVLEEGVHFIQKPFSLNDLARKVRDAIKDR